MFCRQCGAENPDTASRCIKCAAVLQNAGGTPPPPRPMPQQSVPNYLVQSILTTLFCCLPLGIVAIVFAAQVNGKLQAGDYAGAVDSSNKAKMFSWISFGIGLVIGIFYLIGMIAAFKSGHNPAAGYSNPGAPTSMPGRPY